MIKAAFRLKAKDLNLANGKLNRRLGNQERRKRSRQYGDAHLIRDEKDMERHVEYIHYNPVKHGLSTSPKDWEYSSFHRYARKGIYKNEWGAGHGICFDKKIGRE